MLTEAIKVCFILLSPRQNYADIPQSFHSLIPFYTPLCDTDSKCKMIQHFCIEIWLQSVLSEFLCVACICTYLDTTLKLLEMESILERIVTQQSLLMCTASYSIFCVHVQYAFIEEIPFLLCFFFYVCFLCFFPLSYTSARQLSWIDKLLWEEFCDCITNVSYLHNGSSFTVESMVVNLNLIKSVWSLLFIHTFCFDVSGICCLFAFFTHVDEIPVMSISSYFFGSSSSFALSSSSLSSCPTLFLSLNFGNQYLWAFFIRDCLANI